jgi:hypothetical protein
MRELVYKNILGNNPRKREVSIEEVSGREQNKTSRKWVCKYFVKEIFESRSLRVVKNWISENKKRNTEHKCHILRHVDTRTGENSIVCKVLGEFYVIRGLVAFKIMYVNEIKVRILRGVNS